MRILHVLDHSLPLQSGYVFRTLGILGGQRAMGWETFHLTTPRHEASHTSDRPAGGVETVDGWSFFRTAPIDVSWPVIGEGLQVRATARRIVEAARAVSPDAIHAHSPALNGAAALLAARRLRIPVVYEIRAFWEDAAVDHGTARAQGLRYRATRALETFVCRRADHVTTICEGLRTDLVGRGLPADKVTVIPNAVDLAKFGPAGARDAALAAELGLAGEPVVGFIGSFYGYEGLDLLVAALPEIRAQFPAARLLLVGGGPQDEALRAQVAAAGLGDAVIFTGRVHNTQVRRYYDLVDVLAYPRKSMRLTELVTPLKPLEAMAERRIVVASDVGGHRELINDGETGFLHRADDPAALARRVADAFAARDRWDAMRDAGRRFVEAERNWTASTARYEAAFDAARKARG